MLFGDGVHLSGYEYGCASCRRPSACCGVCSGGALAVLLMRLSKCWQRRWILPKAPWAMCPASVSENQVMNVLIPGSRAATRSHSLPAYCSRSGLYGVDADRWYRPLWSVRRESPWSRGGCSAILRLPRSLGYTPSWNTALAGMKQFWQGSLRLLNPGVENCSSVLSPWAWSCLSLALYFLALLTAWQAYRTAMLLTW